MTENRWVNIHRDDANEDQRNDHDREVVHKPKTDRYVRDRVDEIELKSTIDRMSQTTKRGGAKLTVKHVEMELSIVKVVEDETQKVWRPTSRTSIRLVGKIARFLKKPMSAVTEGVCDDEDEESTAMDTDGGAPGAAVSTPVAAPPSDDVVVTSSGSLPAVAQTNDRPTTDEMAVRSYVIMKGAKAKAAPFIRVFDIREARDTDVTCVWVNIVMYGNGDMLCFRRFIIFFEAVLDQLFDETNLL